MQVKRVAFVTSESLKDLLGEEKFLVKYLEQKGVEVKKLVSFFLKEFSSCFQHVIGFKVWTDVSVEWEGFNLLIVRTVWDYTDKYEQFKEANSLLSIATNFF